MQPFESHLLLCHIIVAVSGKVYLNVDQVTWPTRPAAKLCEAISHQVAAAITKVGEEEKSCGKSALGQVKWQRVPKCFQYFTTTIFILAIWQP